ncbi:Radical SAM domain protein [hydrothermal vent metagenome]|uniref:Radical SAM domain protein n=1 Tax=hydrothermal vent metagenome TaxID=652676 RepID=A0A3B0T9F5_9ZZZZ
MAILSDATRNRQIGRAAERPAATEGLVARTRRRGRGVKSNRSGRYERLDRFDIDDGWGSIDALDRFKRQVTDEAPKSIITKNTSPDLAFDRSINPYRGCEHGCVYCYARPTHAYLGHSPGLDFETRLYAKPEAAALLEDELSARGYVPRAIALGTNTDPYQPLERERRITRSVLDVLARARHPVGIVTKSGLVTRDLDLLSDMAAQGLVKVALSITTLDPKLSRAMEPRASAPHVRLQALKQLSEAGVPTVVMTAPVIPGLNDEEIETILARAAAAGAREAGYILLRLPLEVAGLFREWLHEHVPDRAAKVLKLIRSTRNGKENDARFGRRMRGTGPIAWTIGRRFELAARRERLNTDVIRLRTDLFMPPVKKGGQLRLL